MWSTKDTTEVRIGYPNKHTRIRLIDCMNAFLSSDPPVSDNLFNRVGDRWSNDWLGPPDTFDTDDEWFLKTCEFFENEATKAIAHCDALSRTSYSYSQSAIDRAIECDVAVFDEFVHFKSEIVTNAMKDTKKILGAISDKLSQKVNGNPTRSMHVESIISNFKQRILEMEELLRQSVDELVRYRFKERAKVKKRFEVSTLSKHKLVQIGKGGQGTVYSFEISGRKSVAKRYHNEKEQKREVNNMIRVGRHPNVLNMLCRAKLDANHYVILEYCRSSLAEELKMKQPGPLAKNNFSSWIKQLTEGMLHLHGFSLGFGAQLYHGDLKPDNILIAQNESLKIADFGVSELLMDNAGFTGDKPWKGTLRYMAPELHRGKAERKGLKKADVWSWGVVVWEMFANRRPHDTLDENLHPSLPSGTIESLENLLHRCWQSNCIARPTFNHIKVDIENVIDDINDMDKMMSGSNVR
ncbi:hypothetical protein PMAYCL1PPCAC_00762 [Pristionchus mayeri]|uniref:Protein kinase domain-containing protein n=1 Tax=Pristionchus mayeri TaxID=1317129 RepID=A0AAN4Z382_9BILA|nr:hypothetical protein PMAYCL1PPCAC_00762 [Pristionchus mayeri]